MNRGVMGMVALDHITLATRSHPQIPVPCRPALRRPPLPPWPESVGGQVDDKFPTIGRPRVRVGTGQGARVRQIHERIRRRKGRWPRVGLSTQRSTERRIPVGTNPNFRRSHFLVLCSSFVFTFWSALRTHQWSASRRLKPCRICRTMAIGVGSRVGPYEITALIGEGGMGKVWRAHHTGLKRDDALKVLPDAFASDPDRLARFQREAQVLASLNHPNIAARLRPRAMRTACRRS